MKRSIAWLWLIGGVLYAIGTWPFADGVNVVGREEQGSTSSSLTSSIPFLSATAPPKGGVIVEVRAASIAPQSSPAQSSVSEVAVEAEDASEKTQVSNEMHAAFPAERLVVRSTANIRSGPSSKDALIGTAPAGAELDVAEREAGWVRFVDPATSHTGWIHESLLVPFGTEVPSAVERSNTASANVAVRPKSKNQARNVTRVGSGRDTKMQAGGRPAALGYAQPPSVEEFGPNNRRFGFFARRRMLREGFISE